MNHITLYPKKDKDFSIVETFSKPGIFWDLSNHKHVAGVGVFYSHAERSRRSDMKLEAC